MMSKGRARVTGDDELFRCFMRHLPGVAFVKDSEGRYRFINEKAAEVLGRSPDSWLEKTDAELFPNQVAERLRANDRIVLEGGRPHQFVEVFYKDGEPSFWLVNKFPLTLAETGEAAIGGVAVDVTRRIRLEQALLGVRNELASQVDECSEHLREANSRLSRELAERVRAQRAVDGERNRLLSILEHLPVLVLLKGSDYRVRFANEVVRREFLLEGNPRCFEVFRGLDQPCEDCPPDYMTRMEKPCKHECRLKNGRIYEIYDFPFQDIDGTDLILELGIDVTERHAAEEALRESEQNLRRLASEILIAQEQERKRLSQEVHDELGQSLLFLKLKMGGLKREVPARLKSLQGGCQEMLDHMDDVVDKIRRLSHSLSPSVLDDLGLTAALRHLVDEFCKHFRVECCSISIDDVDDLFPPQVQMHLYRLFQEALTNIGKHADATCVTVEVKLLEDWAVFTIVDNGRGFDPAGADAAPDEPRGLGLPTIKERVKFFQGEFDIQSKPGQGAHLMAN
jgi:PAS domain S-box-containing protein